MVEEAEVAMTTLNAPPREWISFITGICARRNLANFRKLWDERAQEEGRRENRESNLNDNEDKDLVFHANSKTNKKKSQGSPSRRPLDFKRGKIPRKYYSCFE